MLRGTHWTLLIFSGRDGGPADSGDLIEVAHEITARFPDTVKPHLILGGFPIADSAPYSTTVLLDPMNHAHDHFGVKDWFGFMEFNALNPFHATLAAAVTTFSAVLIALDIFSILPKCRRMLHFT